MNPPTSRAWFRPRLVHRVWFYGLLLLIAAVATVLSVGQWLVRPALEARVDPLLVALVQSHLEGKPKDQLPEQAKRLFESKRVRVSIFDEHQQLLASTQSPIPFAPPRLLLHRLNEPVLFEPPHLRRGALDILGQPEQRPLFGGPDDLEFPPGPRGFPPGPRGFPPGPRGFPPGPRGFPPGPPGEFEEPPPSHLPAAATSPGLNDQPARPGLAEHGPGAPAHAPHGMLVVPLRLPDDLRAVALVELPPPRIPWWPALLWLSLLLGLLLVLSLWFARSITRPVERLSSAMKALGAGQSVPLGSFERDDELGQLAVTFHQLVDDLARLRRTEHELLASISHELRTPVARMRVLLELARDGEPSEIQRYTGELAVDLDELEVLLSEVFTLTRFELALAPGAGSALKRERFSASELIAALMSRFWSHHPARELTVEACQSEGWLDADPKLLRRALDNLLDNAVKYSESAQGPILLRTEQQSGRLSLSVVDRGCGLDPASLARIFEPFYRADRSRSRATGGVGLGLTLAKRIVEAHGGLLDVTSTLGEGSIFTVSLPLVATERPPAMPSPVA